MSSGPTTPSSAPATHSRNLRAASSFPWVPSLTETGAVPEVSVVVPVYYEHEVIAATLEGLERTLDRHSEILVVYDTEDDPTAATVRQGQARWPRARLVRNDYGRGVVGALKTGIRRADGRYVVVFMADMSDEPDVIQSMVAQVDQGHG